ncbi:hypothetical protein [Nonomuraea africana]|uniref:Uncharacterized protein n=1 Tax=Nonomuraea africana TaxID=46171 RepID=A0ABR9KJ76_9ACTN|nr:hypothetical protein [Nonomuraea africana]MBE1562069.1 hypothetical protein [Nonomuraea africana]
MAFDDLHLHPERSAVGDDRALEPLVDQNFLDSGGLGGQTVQQRGTGDILMRRGSQHHHRDDQAEHVHGQAALRPGTFLPASLPVVSAGTPAAACTL